MTPPLWQKSKEELKSFLMKVTEESEKVSLKLTIAMERIKYLGINLPKETKDLYIENYETLMKEIKRTLIDGEIYHVHGSEESIIQ